MGWFCSVQAELGVGPLVELEELAHLVRGRGRGRGS